MKTAELIQQIVRINNQYCQSLELIEYSNDPVPFVTIRALGTNVINIKALNVITYLLNCDELWINEGKNGIEINLNDWSEDDWTD